MSVKDWQNPRLVGRGAPAGINDGTLSRPRDTNADKPFCPCESPTMGNGPGGLGDYWDLI